MTWTHLHLLINHLPLVGLLFGAAALIAALWRQSTDLQAFGLGAQAFLGLMSCVVFSTGGPAADAAADLAAQPVDDHYQAARIAMIAATCLGTGALGALLLPKKPGTAPSWAVALVLVGTLACLALLGWAGYLGGLLRHL